MAGPKSAMYLVCIAYVYFHLIVWMSASNTLTHAAMQCQYVLFQLAPPHRSIFLLATLILRSVHSL
jgi:hypothetical protein